MFVCFVVVVVVFSTAISGGPISLSSLFGIDCLLPHFVMSWLVRTLTCKQHIFSFFFLSFFSSGICGLLASNVSNVFFVVYLMSCFSSGISSLLAIYIMYFLRLVSVRAFQVHWPII